MLVKMETQAAMRVGTEGEYYFQGKTGIVLFKNGQYISLISTSSTDAANFILNNISDVVSATNGTYSGVRRCRIVFSKDKYLIGTLGEMAITNVPYKLTAGNPLDIYQQGDGTNWSQAIAIFDDNPADW